jgi:hypothetical protein
VFVRPWKSVLHRFGQLTFTEHNRRAPAQASMSVAMAGALGGGYAGAKIQENQRAEHTHGAGRRQRVAG